MLLEQSNEFVFLIPLPLVLCLYAASEQSWLVDGPAASRTYRCIALSAITVSGDRGGILGVTTVALGLAGGVLVVQGDVLSEAWGRLLVQGGDRIVCSTA